MTAMLHHGLAADIMRREIPDRSIDMVYIDPPFGNQQVWRGHAGAFSDRHRQDDAEAVAGWSALRQHHPIAAMMLEAARLSDAGRAYLGKMADILIEIRRVLRLTGTLWLHFDDVMGAYLRILSDGIFGGNCAFGLITWKRTTTHSGTAKAFGRIHDTIAIYGRSRAALARLARLRGQSAFGVPDPLDHAAARPWIEGIAEDRLTATSSERVGYPTQKPASLISKFIAAATLPGDTVLDPTMGSGTTLVAARALQRHAIGIDASLDALAVTRQRLGLAEMARSSKRQSPAAELPLFGATA